MHDLNKCAHPPCGCPAPEGEKYCSTYCRDLGAVAEMTCKCGHRGCTPAPAEKADRS